VKPANWEIPLDAVSSRILDTGLKRANTALETTDWAISDPLIRNHRLEGLLVHAVASLHLPSTPDQRRKVAQLEVNLTRDRIWHDMRLIEITEMLRDASIEQRVLKGPAFGTLDYPDRIMRPTGDIDLLVRGDELPGAIETLVVNGGSVVDPEPIKGYTQVIGKSTTVTMPDGLEVDLHRMLVRGPFGVRMRPEDLWRRSREFAIGGVPMATLGLEESLIHACFHLMILSDKRALTVRDVAQFLANPALDTDTVIELSRAWKAQIVLGAAVLLTTSMIPAVADTDLLPWARALKPGPMDRTYLRIARPGATMGPAEWPATLIALRSNSARVMLIRSILRPIDGTNPPFLRRVRRLVGRLMHNLRSSVHMSSNSLKQRSAPESVDQHQQNGHQ
jgi:hypothetical protein